MIPVSDEAGSRTLYLRFKNKFPATEDEVKDLHPSIVGVRVPRQGRKKKQIKYCFIDINPEAEKKEVKDKIVGSKFQGEKVYVDFEGQGSKKAKKDVKSGNLNPCKLIVYGLVPGVSWKALKEMFPKASHAEIPKRSRKKGSKYGFVEFANPADARATFDAAQDLNIDGHHITVLYAKVMAHDRENVKERRVKRRAEKEGTTVEEYREKETQKYLKRKESRGESIETSPVKKAKIEVEKESVGDRDSDEENESDDGGDVENDEESDDEDGQEEDCDDDGNDNEDDDSDDDNTDSDDADD